MKENGINWSITKQHLHSPNKYKIC